MKLFLVVFTLMILIAVIQEQSLESILECNRIYTGKLADKIAKAYKATKGNVRTILVAVYLFIIVMLWYFGLIASYINLPMYTNMVLGYLILEFIEIASIVSCLVSFKLHIFKKSYILFSKVKLVATYIVLLLGLALTIIR